MAMDERLFPATLMPDDDWWRALWPDPDATIRALHIASPMTVVDVGCGDGYFTAAIARTAHRGRVIGVDLDAALLEKARAACTGLANCECRAGDAMDLRNVLGPGAPVDHVLIANTFHGVREKGAFAHEVAAVLKPGGLFAIVNWAALGRDQTRVLGQPRGPRTELRMSPEQTRAVVEPAGFEQEAIVELAPYHYGSIFRKTRGGEG